ncbi:hypothetical protein BCR34DRAFT_198889 [Clohesyomyces aquaticus]|uniref:Uncharacterized protein n=1 Tax=Clohesyomyces aquaticus TaxID=1231657 RepID=A0A1Y1ZXW4_9PLEO|nr:hypothetical protein BCR34DRAFT_198889 [Clohesyomyces aquaticus]
MGEVVPAPTRVPDTRCWRCILLNRLCDRMPICKTCLDLGNDGLRILSCKRGEITKDFDEAFSGFNEIAPGTWWYRSGDRCWKMTVDWEKFGRDVALIYGVVDWTWLLPENKRIARGATIVPFLDQFANARWHEVDGHTTIIHSAAYLAMACDLPTPILAALRCLVISYNIGQIDANMPFGWFVNDDFGYDQYEIQQGSYEPRTPAQTSTFYPEIVVERLSEGDPLLEEPIRPVYSDDCLATLLRTTVESTRVLLLKGDPTNWPSVFYVLCILLLVHSDLDVASSFTDVFRTAANSLYHGIENLAALYLHCCEDMHPLNDEGIDADWFHLMVGPDPAFDPEEDYFRWNNAWLETRTVAHVTLTATCNVNEHPGQPDERTKTVKSFLRHLTQLVDGRVGF